MRVLNKMASIIGKFINRLPVIFVKSFSFLSSIALVILLLVFVGAYFLDKHFTGGYYSAYLIQLFLVDGLDWVWEFSYFMEVHLFWAIALICVFFAVLFFLKSLLRRILTKHEHKHNLFTNIVYLASNVALSIIILSAAGCIVFNAMITSYINSAIGQNGLESANFLEKSDFIKQQIQENKNLSSVALHKIMFDIENKAEYIHNADFLALCTEVNHLIALQGGPQSEDEHYMRNSLNSVPPSLDEMLGLISDTDERTWILMSPEDAILHMFGADGEYNLKFVSVNGFFEAIYNKDGELLTEQNNPVNMGTYNYANPVSEPVEHSKYDVVPYFQWGNTPTDEPPEDLEIMYNNLEKFQNNAEAVERYNHYYNLIENHFAS